ncbi:hypothetical protein HME9302_01083 [Alteripontixanthobacter maritimus]|uniref:Uncharacterized protein n=1 Tax=Alteripontixanthobacter maritimus TaxID=2161824 RepID=A0A369Q9L9_9SPHN|nr:rod shape-determining protein MreD [Alteripontixanthobacter maritimus]RDC59886.1 hypothetical protein HME9302_01083 [Alteripontixanthobacter maritimus]
MERLNPRSRSDAYGRRINRDHSPLLGYIVPWLSILIAIVLPIFVMATPGPLMPPLGFLMLVAWRLLRPGLFPVWAGFPLGLVDDLFSGQPFGSGILLWSLAMLAIEIIESRFPWRSFWQDWFAAVVLVIAYLLAAFLLSGAPIGLPALIVLAPQLLLSVLAYPIIARMVAFLDRLRLMRVRTIG